MLRLRSATPDDIAAMLATEAEAASASHWNESVYRRLVADDRRSVLVLEQEGVLQGFIVGHDLGPEWEIENMAVASASRRRGLGRLLVEGLLELAARRGAQAVLLEVRTSSQPARALYQACGFVETGRRRNYYSEPQEDAVTCKISLPQHPPKPC